MSSTRAGWEVEELDPTGDASVLERAKPIVRRVPARWDEREDTLRTTIGLWSVDVRRGPVAGWEWSAFSHGAPRALRCTGFSDREAAQEDAERSLARLE
ncbi:Hypothetical protein A7982_08428 [Minicystis rosea]|nr:Hypothetical protein A7982_08428 [Minicystis rosea]